MDPITPLTSDHYFVTIQFCVLLTVTLFLTIHLFSSFWVMPANLALVELHVLSRAMKATMMPTIWSNQTGSVPSANYSVMNGGPQSKKKAHHQVSYVWPACRTPKVPVWNINTHAIYEKWPFLPLSCHEWQVMGPKEVLYSYLV